MKNAKHIVKTVLFCGTLQQTVDAHFDTELMPMTGKDAMAIWKRNGTFQRFWTAVIAISLYVAEPWGIIRKVLAKQVVFFLAVSEMNEEVCICMLVYNLAETPVIGMRIRQNNNPQSVSSFRFRQQCHAVPFVFCVR